MGGSWERMIGIVCRTLDAMLLKVAPTRLTHEVLVTLLSKVMAIDNNRPLTAVSTDPDNPTILTPSSLLTQKIGVASLPPGQFDDSDVYRCQWRHVQYLANTFWERWKKDYLSTLQG